jgi:MFS family permease
MIKWLGASPLAVLGSLVVVSVLVGVILATVGLDPFDMVGSVQWLIRFVWDIGFWLWRYFLLGAAFVIPIWLIIRLLELLPAMVATKAWLKGRYDHLKKLERPPRPQSLQVIKPQTIKRLQIIGTALCVLVGGGLAVQRTLNPQPNAYLARTVEEHPIASVVGTLLPIVIGAPFGYWMFGRIFRRIAARYKVCEHCAETIKSDANVCRYCGRDVASSAPKAASY